MQADLPAVTLSLKGKLVAGGMCCSKLQIIKKCFVVQEHPFLKEGKMSNNRQLKQNALTRTDGVMAAAAAANERSKRAFYYFFLLLSIYVLCVCELYTHWKILNMAPKGELTEFAVVYI